MKVYEALRKCSFDVDCLLEDMTFMHQEFGRYNKLLKETDSKFGSGSKQYSMEDIWTFDDEVTLDNSVLKVDRRSSSSALGGNGSSYNNSNSNSNRDSESASSKPTISGRGSSGRLVITQNADSSPVQKKTQTRIESFFKRG